MSYLLTACCSHHSVLGTTGLQELEGLARHALFREYPPYAAEAPLQPQVMAHAAHTHRHTALANPPASRTQAPTPPLHLPVTPPPPLVHHSFIPLHSSLTTPSPLPPPPSPPPQLLRMAAEASRRFAEMAAHWVRVGYTHSP